MTYDIRNLLERLNSTGIGCLLDITFHCNISFDVLNELLNEDDPEKIRSAIRIRGNECSTIDFQFSDGKSYLGKISWGINDFIDDAPTNTENLPELTKVDEKKMGAYLLKLFRLEITAIQIENGEGEIDTHAEFSISMTDDISVSDGHESYGKASIRLYTPKEGIAVLNEQLSKYPQYGIMLS